MEGIIPTGKEGDPKTSELVEEGSTLSVLLAKSTRSVGLLGRWVSNAIVVFPQVL